MLWTGVQARTLSGSGGSGTNEPGIEPFGNNTGDILTGNDGSDRIVGGGGADQLFGNAGQRYSGRGAGDDLLDGAAGRDLISGQDGNDFISAGSMNTRSPAEMVMTSFTRMGAMIWPMEIMETIKSLVDMVQTH